MNPSTVSTTGVITFSAKVKGSLSYIPLSLIHISGTDLEQEARDAACPVKKFFADTRKAISDWFYQTMPI